MKYGLIFPLAAALLLTACGDSGSGGTADLIGGKQPIVAPAQTAATQPLPTPTLAPIALVVPYGSAPEQAPIQATPAPQIVYATVVVEVTRVYVQPVEVPQAQAYQMPVMPPYEPWPADPTGCHKDSQGIWVCP